MCMITDWKKPKIAQEDIHVFKEMGTPYSNNKIRSPYEGFVYIKGKLYETEMREGSVSYFDDDEGNFWVGKDNLRYIGPGFHSAETRERLTYVDSDYIYHAIIPKGSEYYYSPNHLYVSNKIIIGEPFEN